MGSLKTLSGKLECEETPMADATYDAVIIGAGHNGMALGTYLAKSGWDVAIFEKRAEEGGGLCTEELTRAGFLHNVHCNYHTLVGVSPVYKDLELSKHGLRYERPPVQMGSVFSDGTALTVHTDIDKTCASIARFSQKDADTFRRLIDETKGYLDLILTTLMYSPPLSMNDITKALVAWGVEDKAEFLSVHLRRISINQFLDQHFENDKVKAHLAFHASLAGYSTDRKGLATSFPLLVGKIDNWHVCVGGSHALAHSLWEAFGQAGGRVFLKHGVERIIVENGKAVGLELEDGSSVRARKLVASSINVEQTFLKMLDRDLLSDGFVEATKSTPHMDWSYFSVHLAMQRAPQYKAAEFDPAPGPATQLRRQLALRSHRCAGGPLHGPSPPLCALFPEPRWTGGVGPGGQGVRRGMHRGVAGGGAQPQGRRHPRLGHLHAAGHRTAHSEHGSG
jgi:phytoene dehydrogenase-like protein